jgi:hypothetical protein
VKPLLAATKRQGKYDSLLRRARSESDAKFWKPTEAEESIAGEVVSISVGGKYNSTYYHVQTEHDGVLIVSASPSTVLGKKLMDHDVQKGDALAIIYLGEHETKDGRGTFKKWSVATQKQFPATTEPPKDDDIPY